MAVKRLSNVDLWNTIRNAYPTFESHTAKATKETFTEKGWSVMKTKPVDQMQEFWGLAIPFVLNIVNISHAVDRLAEAGFGEVYEMPYGGIIQRMSVNSIKPISPGYKGLKDFDTCDPFVVRKPEAENRFFVQNFDYQSLVTMPDEFQQKQMFISEYGFSEFLAGVFEGLENGYKIQLYENKLEVIDKGGLNNTQYPLQASQKIMVSLSEDPTEQELIDFIYNIKMVLTTMTIGPQTDKFNAYKFATTPEVGRLKLLMRPGIKQKIELMVARNSYHLDSLTLPVDIIEVPNFGGLEAYKEVGLTTKLYPVYDKLGTMIGWAESAGQTSVTTQLGKEYYKDRNSKTVAVLADRGCVFESRQNEYSVKPIYNPRGLYTNYWASAPNNAINFDPLYTFVAFQTA